MKTFAEVEQWCRGAAERFGDPAFPICQLFVRYLPDAAGYRGDELVCSAGLTLWLNPDTPLPLAIAAAGPCSNALGELTAFGAQPVVPGVWFLTPSLYIPGVIHAFVVLYDVPNPAPWQKAAA